MGCSLWARVTEGPLPEGERERVSLITAPVNGRGEYNPLPAPGEGQLLSEQQYHLPQYLPPKASKALSAASWHIGRASK